LFQRQVDYNNLSLGVAQVFEHSQSLMSPDQVTGPVVENKRLAETESLYAIF
jgi:hypothetical protein